MLNHEISYPRSREETSAPLTSDELVPILRENWTHDILDIQQAQSRRVHYVQWSHRRVMVRVNLGWDGPSPPSLLVEFVDHLAQQNTPAPAIIPTLSLPRKSGQSVKHAWTSHKRLVLCSPGSSGVS